MITSSLSIFSDYTVAIVKNNDVANFHVQRLYSTVVRDDPTDSDDFRHEVDLPAAEPVSTDAASRFWDSTSLRFDDHNDHVTDEYSLIAS